MKNIPFEILYAVFNRYGTLHKLIDYQFILHIINCIIVLHIIKHD